MLVCGCGSRVQALPGIWGLWPYLLQLPKMTEEESPWGAWKPRLKGMQGPSVRLSFSPRDENPPDLRAVQLSAHYLQLLLAPTTSFPSVPSGLQQGLRVSPDGPGRRVRPLPQLCLGKCLVWMWSGGSLWWAGMKKAEGAVFPPPSLRVTAAPSLIPRGAERWLKKPAATAHPWTGSLRAPESCLRASPETSLLASCLTPRPWLPPAPADAPSQAVLRSPAQGQGEKT